VLAYQQTHYRVLGAVPTLLQVGVASGDLAILHATHQTDCSAFITACNPLGVITNDAANAQRQQALRAELSRKGRVVLPGIGQHPTGAWPGEPSYLVLGLTRAAAQALGRQFQQNAIIWAGANTVPELILLR
jgi:hypothetical protein